MSIQVKNYQTPGQKSIATPVYSDIDLKFKPHKGTKDVSKRINANAISQALRTICLTNPGDLDEEPDFGVGVWSLLGENFTPIEVLALKERIFEQCSTYEPRAELTQVDVEWQPTLYEVRIRIRYYPLNVNSEEEVNVTVQRIL